MVDISTRRFLIYFFTLPNIYCEYKMFVSERLLVAIEFASRVLYHETFIRHDLKSSTTCKDFHYIAISVKLRF